jgi:hypothetical protein
MTKVPYAFQNAVRNVYVSLLEAFAKDAGLILDLKHYNEDVIISTGFIRSSEIVAIIRSHSQWGEPDDLTNEYSPRRHNRRIYTGLKIMVKNFRYRQQIEKFADNMRRQLDEDVIVEDEPDKIS